MKLLSLGFMTFLLLGCGPEVDKCNNSCGANAICDDAGICQPRTREDFYNPARGRYERFFNIAFETFPYCIYYNYSYADTPWILPSLMSIYNTHRFDGFELRTLIFDSTKTVREDNRIKTYDLIFKRDATNKVTDMNLIFRSNKYFSFDIFFENKSMVSSWVGKLSPDRKRIDFKIYFFENKSRWLYEVTDTVKIINRSYVVHPECRSDCKFCFDCE
jgi:hypothetical protein